MLCAICQLLDFVGCLCIVFSSEICFYWLIVCLLFGTWLMCVAYLIFSPLLFFLNIYHFVAVCMCFRKRQQCHWAPTHKLSALDTQRRMLSLIRPTQRTTVRPLPPSLSLVHSLCGSLYLCFTLFSLYCVLQLNQRVTHFLTHLVCLLFV